MSINVLIVDDSALLRKFLSETVTSEPDFNLVGTAQDPFFAIKKLSKFKVDVIILDVEMPKMDGLTFLEKIMNFRPIPIIIFSSLTQENSSLTFKAYELGAFEVIGKPKDLSSLSCVKENIISTIRAAGDPNVKLKLKIQHDKGEVKHRSKDENRSFTLTSKTTDKIIAIGSSTGGTVALFEVLKKLPVDIPGIVVVQHLPERYSQSFASRLDTQLKLRVKVAEDNEVIKNGIVYIAPGDFHCYVVSSGAKYIIKITQTEKVNYHRPSVEVLFDSVAKHVGHNAVGVMLTGMGEDGSMAMKRMKDSGSYNVVQDRASSIVWGMPGKAVEYNAADVILPLNKIAESICNYLNI